jgi:hypothetical protein
MGVAKTFHMPTISEHDALPAGTRLGEFEIQQVLGIGGFGIVYLAVDHALQRQVAIKEYMPAALSARGVGAEVVVRSAAHANPYQLGLRSFINEARMLARFDHPSLVKVYQFWEAHGTAYMVMPYYRGQTLQQVRRDMNAPPDEAWLRRLITPLLGALECLHRENVYHRDVAPDNILLLDSEDGPAMGQPVLLDLGAARRVIGDQTQSLTAIVKPSFAPIEQYAETVQLRQGPWTDLYALAAVVHYCITGRAPTPATVRAVQDDLPSLRQMSAGLASGFDRAFSEPFVHAIDHALAIRPQDRPESVSAWREEFSGIVGEEGAGQARSGREQGEGWFAQTVLVRGEQADTPPGHAAIENHAYLTTVPAAGRLHARPAVSGRHSTAVAAEAGPPALATSVPATVPLGDAGSIERHRDVRPALVPTPSAQYSRAGGTQTWMKWVFLSLLLMSILAVWWSKRHVVKHEATVAEQASARPGGMALKPVTVPTLVAAAEGKVAADSKAEQAPATLAEADSEAAPSDLAASKAARASKKAALLAERQARQAAQAASRAEGAAAKPKGPLDPRQACANRHFIMRAICMKRHCDQAAYSAHPECVRMREMEAAQRNSYP